MKFYLSLLLIFILLIVLGFTVINSLSVSTARIINNFDQIIYAIDSKDWTTAEKQFSLTKQRWDTQKKWWAMIIDHNEIDDIDIALIRTDEYIKHRNQVLSSGELSVLKQSLEHIPETQKISLINIF